MRSMSSSIFPGFQHTIAFSHDYNTTQQTITVRCTHTRVSRCRTYLRENQISEPADAVHIVPVNVSCGEVWEVNLQRHERPGNVFRRDGLNAVLCWTRDETRRDSPVGFAGVVLVRNAYGFLHPLRVDPPQLQRVIHPTRHDLLPEQVEVLKAPAFRDATVSVLTEFLCMLLKQDCFRLMLFFRPIYIV